MRLGPVVFGGFHAYGSGCWGDEGRSRRRHRIRSERWCWDGKAGTGAVNTDVSGPWRPAFSVHSVGCLDAHCRQLLARDADQRRAGTILVSSTNKRVNRSGIVNMVITEKEP